ncbi:HNH endonuclease signature motif containing protein [Stenotrophomonas maltophilia]|uniref:HNH endonuclease n=1 Tax=Stenotrophomonas maltophilia TaxID=40324 RepID=UPI0013D8EA13|nr:HNH endonuclease signature motif containing protein [Stenotrophomonas maltophilia]
MSARGLAGNRQAKRALPTNSRAWRALRETILVRDLYRCQEQGCGVLCSRRGQAHVDHADGDPNNNAPENLRTMCISCHSRKTAREDGGFGNAQHVVVGCDADGWPIKEANSVGVELSTES